MAEAADPILIEFLRWIATAPRTYAETMEVWRTTCPRHSVWENALLAGLIELEGMSNSSRVSVSTRGREFLEKDG